MGQASPRRWRRVFPPGAAILLAASLPLFAAQPTTPLPFDPVVATDAYLATVAGEARARSDAYFEGGYWLQLWNFLLSVAVNLAILASGLSRRMRDLADRLGRFPPLRTFAYWILYLLLTSLALFPLTVYEGFFREHAYDLSNQTFGAWLGDEAKGLAVGAILGGLVVAGLYGVVRRLPRSWPVWGAVTGVVFVILGTLIAPAYIAPLFNDYTPLTDPVVREPILTLARAQGVAAEDVFVYDASRQTKRVSANVSGVASTLRISLNDNLLSRCSMGEIEAVMAHEIGHYVLNHVYKGILFVSLVIGGGFVFLRWGFERGLALRGAAWKISGPSDPAGLPLAMIVLSTYFAAATPVLNSFSRTVEAEADLFGINASGQPDGHARVDLKVGEYRKLDPSPLEELLFYDHPGGRNRILMAMRWKAEHLAEAEANARRAADADRARGFGPEQAEASTGGERR